MEKRKLYESLKYGQEMDIASTRIYEAFRRFTRNNRYTENSYSFMFLYDISVSLERLLKVIQRMENWDDPEFEVKGLHDLGMVFKFVKNLNSNQKPNWLNDLTIFYQKYRYYNVDLEKEDDWKGGTRIFSTLLKELIKFNESYENHITTNNSKFVIFRKRVSAFTKLLVEYIFELSSKNNVFIQEFKNQELSMLFEWADRDKNNNQSFDVEKWVWNEYHYSMLMKYSIKYQVIRPIEILDDFWGELALLNENDVYGLDEMLRCLMEDDIEDYLEEIIGSANNLKREDFMSDEDGEQCIDMSKIISWRHEILKDFMEGSLIFPEDINESCDYDDDKCV